MSISCSNNNLCIAVRQNLLDDSSVDAVAHTRNKSEKFLLRQCTCIRENAKGTPDTIVHAVLSKKGKRLAGTPLMCDNLPHRRLQVLDHLRLGVTERKLIGNLVEMCSLANPLKRVHTQAKLRRCVDDVLDVARIDKSRQMKDDRGTQPRTEIGRIRCQIPHRLVKGKIQTLLNIVIHP